MKGPTQTVQDGADRGRYETNGGNSSHCSMEDEVVNAKKAQRKVLGDRQETHESALKSVGVPPTAMCMMGHTCNATCDFAYVPGTAETDFMGMKHCTRRGSEDGGWLISEPLSYSKNYEAKSESMGGEYCATHYVYLANSTVSMPASLLMDKVPMCVSRETTIERLATPFEGAGAALRTALGKGLTVAVILKSTCEHNTAARAYYGSPALGRDPDCRPGSTDIAEKVVETCTCVQLMGVTKKSVTQAKQSKQTVYDPGPMSNKKPSREPWDLFPCFV